MNSNTTPGDAAAPRPHVVFIINSLAGGGAERVVSRLLEHSLPWQSRYRVSLVLLDKDPAAYGVEEWVQVHQLDCRHRTLESIRQLRRTLRSIKPDITLSFLTRSNVANAVAMIGSGRPWIISERINTSAHLGSGLRALVTKASVRMTYPRATKIIAVSEGVRAELVRNFGVRPSRVEAIANPVDVRAIREAAALPSELALEQPYVLALGRLVKSKNHAMMIRAFAQSRLPGRLVIGGEGPERGALAQLAAELGVADRVLLTGFLGNPYPVLGRAHVFALSSDVEGFPNALVEALALDVPVVATDCPDGPAEILAGKPVGQHRQVTVTDAGILTPCGDVESFSRALQLAFDAEVRSRIIAGGASRVKEYSPIASVKRYWAVIETALATPDQRAPARDGG